MAPHRRRLVRTMSGVRAISGVRASSKDIWVDKGESQMNVTRIILPTLALAAVGFAQDVRYNFDKGANFGAYKTYKWVQIKDAPKLNQLVDQQVKTAIEGELAKKGLTQVTGDDANLLI